jgi:hypothetical protein
MKIAKIKFCIIILRCGGQWNANDTLMASFHAFRPSVAFDWAGFDRLTTLS